MSELDVEDILNPRTVWIDEACYRINRKKTGVQRRDINQSQSVTGTSYTDNEDLRCDEYNDPEVEVTENGRFKTYILLPHVFYSYIIGTKGFRRKRLEDETKTDISIPRQANNNKIVITGATERSVVVARHRLEMIGDDLRNRHMITHFISFPMTSVEIKSNFKKFKDLILSGGHIDGVDESIFQKVDKLHLTIGTLVLLDDSEKEEAAELLETLKKDVIVPHLKSCSPLIIKMKGLQYMNDDPSQVDVLYAKVQIINDKNSDILQTISDDIVDYFHQNGLMKKESDHVKLHATLINTRYRKDGNDVSGSRGKDRSKRIAFDARPILQKFADFDFGQQQLDFIHLSHRFSVDGNGYYEPVHKIACK